MSVSRNTRHQRQRIHHHDIHTNPNDRYGYEIVSAAENLHQTAKLLAKFINSVNEGLKAYAKSNKNIRKEQKDFDDLRLKINQESNQESNSNSKMNYQKDEVDSFKNVREKQGKGLGIVDDGKMDVQIFSNNQSIGLGQSKPLSIEGKTLQNLSSNKMSAAAKLSYNHLTNLQQNLMQKNTRKNSKIPIKIPKTLDNPKKEKQNSQLNHNVFKVEMKNFLKLSARHVGIAYNIHIQNMKATYDPLHWKEKLEPIPIQLRRMKKDPKIKVTK